MTKVTLMEIQEQESFSAQNIIKELLAKGTIAVHIDDLADVVINYSNQEMPLKMFHLGDCYISVSI